MNTKVVQIPIVLNGDQRKINIRWEDDFIADVYYHDNSESLIFPNHNEVDRQRVIYFTGSSFKSGIVDLLSTNNIVRHIFGERKFTENGRLLGRTPAYRVIDDLDTRFENQRSE